MWGNTEGIYFARKKSLKQYILILKNGARQTWREWEYKIQALQNSLQNNNVFKHNGFIFVA